MSARPPAPMMRARAILALLLLAGALAACGAEPPPERAAEAPARLVRTLTIEAAKPAEAARFTGRIVAQDQSALAFRIGGRMTERLVRPGERVGAGQRIAAIDPEDALNAFRAADAQAVVAESLWRKAESRFQRQVFLLDRGAISEAQFEEAEQTERALRARFEAAEAYRGKAEERVTFTVLYADAPGVITTIGAEPGEVVGPGRMIATLARDGGVDGLFSVPAEIASGQSVGARIEVALSDAPERAVEGFLREVSPQADADSRTFRIRVGLIDPPEGFRLGASVVARISVGAKAPITISESALLPGDAEPRVFVVDPATLRVRAKTITIERRDPARVIVASGLSAGDIVVTAGVRTLTEGQMVRLNPEGD